MFFLMDITVCTYFSVCLCVYVCRPFLVNCSMVYSKMVPTKTAKVAFAINHLKS